MSDVVQKIQFKRGTKAILEARLISTDLGVLLEGEPAWETDTGQLKIGDGKSAYIDLPYMGGGGEDSRFVITDPKENQILVYDSELKKWVNKTTIFEHSSDEVIAGKVYHVLWKVTPTATNEVSGITTSPDNGQSIVVYSKNGVKTLAKITDESNTISNSDIDKLFQ